jgi:hypothetical protein
MLDNVTKEYKMHKSTILTYIGQTLIATAIVMVAWDGENGIPLMQFGLIFAGFLLGHVLTEVLNYVDSDEE